MSRNVQTESRQALNDIYEFSSTRPSTQQHYGTRRTTRPFKEHSSEGQSGSSTVQHAMPLAFTEPLFSLDDFERITDEAFNAHIRSELRGLASLASKYKNVTKLNIKENMLTISLGRVKASKPSMSLPCTSDFWYVLEASASRYQAPGEKGLDGGRVVGLSVLTIRPRPTTEDYDYDAISQTLPRKD
ncbi:hypothetical protein C8Q80DRAFT_1346363 [Daedaleopsis nitida]|nr:hypothetical protein C8Q80DRAFT_1346363 [Daedaleopsis nitida]